MTRHCLPALLSIVSVGAVLSACRQAPLAARIVGSFASHERGGVTAIAFRPDGTFDETAQMPGAPVFTHAGRYVIRRDTIYLRFGETPNDGEAMAVVLRGDSLDIGAGGGAPHIYLREQ